MPDSKKMVCYGCGWMYDEEKGHPPAIAAGTPWEKVPEDFSCPTCGFTKDLFDSIGTSVWRSRPDAGSIHPGNDSALSDALQDDMGRK